MAKPEKEKVVAELANTLSSSDGVYLADYKGLNVEEINDLRTQLRNVKVDFKVIKNTLAKISASEIGWDDLNEYFTGPTAVAISREDPIIGAKILTDFRKKNENLSLKACVFEGQVYDKDRIEEIAKLPSKEEVIAQTVGMFGAPLRGMVNVLHGLLTASVVVLNEIKKQKES